MSFINKGKLSGKINIIDILIILVIITAIIGVYYKFSKSNSDNLIFNKPENIQVVFLMKMLPTTLRQRLKKGIL